MDSITAALIGAVSALLLNVWTDFKGWKKVERLIGNLHDTTLGRQHEDIEKNIDRATGDIKERTHSISNEVGKVESWVNRINEMLTRNEERYSYLSVEQREIRNNVMTIVNSWEELVKENRELKQVVRELSLENDKLKEQNKNLDREKGRER
ncbi:hypothetical protein [Tepidanaerobacter acetatoxydans]|uniref:hypothetical protein n=1 Tax=Tepidanaerobacter acetatoxydans TaxID=499229 RepID=UPI001BD1DBD0|nr:hypothetical protein [Tepidanaerobacter acetatoxydans]